MLGVSPLKVFHCVCTSKNLLLSPQSQPIFNAATVEKSSSSSWRQVEEVENWETKNIIMTANFHSNDARLLILILMYIIHASSSHLLEQTSFEIFAFKKVVSSSSVCVLFVHYRSWRRWLRHVHLSSSPLYFLGYLMWLLSRLLFINAEQQSLGI